MTIQINQKMPDVSLKIAAADGTKDVSTHALFGGKKSIVFALPGAFTPVCTAQHLPDFANNKDAFEAVGIKQIVCLSVNDPFVMQAWAEKLNIGNRIVMLCDGSAEFTKALGMTVDLSSFGLGVRSKRYAMIVENNVIKHVEIEEQFTSCSVTSAGFFIKLMSIHT